MVAAELKVVGGKHAGQVIPLNRRKFLIGREQDCQLRPNSDMVSRHHCVFSVDDYSVRLRDLGSTNGTLVNGERIRKETVLAAGDRIVIGAAAETFCLERTTGELLWRKPTPRAASVVTPAGIARIGTDGAITVHDYATGDVTLRTWIAPRVSGPSAAAARKYPPEDDFQTLRQRYDEEY